MADPGPAQPAFPHFPLLPWEIRNAIWNLALRPCLFGPDAHYFRLHHLPSTGNDRPDGHVAVARRADLPGPRLGLAAPFSPDSSDSSGEHAATAAAAAPSAPTASFSPSQCWTRSSPSACLLDSGVWTACRESHLAALNFFTKYVVASQDRIALGYFLDRDPVHSGRPEARHFAISPARDVLMLKPDAPLDSFLLQASHLTLQSIDSLRHRSLDPSARGWRPLGLQNIAFEVDPAWGRQLATEQRVPHPHDSDINARIVHARAQAERVQDLPIIKALVHHVALALDESSCRHGGGGGPGAPLDRTIWLVDYHGIKLGKGTTVAGLQSDMASLQGVGPCPPRPLKVFSIHNRGSGPADARRWCYVEVPMPSDGAMFRPGDWVFVPPGRRDDVVSERGGEGSPTDDGSPDGQPSVVSDADGQDREDSSDHGSDDLDVMLEASSWNLVYVLNHALSAARFEAGIWRRSMAAQGNGLPKARGARFGVLACVPLEAEAVG